MNPIAAKPHPDEFSRSHLHRVTKVFGFNNPSAYVEYLRRNLENAPGDIKSMPVAKLLAHSSGVAWPDYQANHTFLHFIAYGAARSSFVSQGELSDGAIRVGGFITPRAYPHFCAKCTAIDLNQLKYSYWRRSHQMPGQFWCQEHPSELLQVVSRIEGYEESPADCIKRGISAQVSPMGIEQHHPKVQAFYRTSELLLQSEILCRRDSMLRALQDKAIALGIGTNKKNIKSWVAVQLSDVALDTLPLAFVRDIFPRIQDKIPNQIFVPIDQALMAGGSSKPGAAVALAIALLFDAPEEAFNSISLNPDARRKASPSSRASFLVDRLRAHNGNIEKVASDLGETTLETQNYILAKRFLILQKFADGKEGNGLRDFVNGISISGACAQHGISIDLLEFIVRLKLQRKLPK